MKLHRRWEKFKVQVSRVLGLGLESLTGLSGFWKVGETTGKEPIDGHGCGGADPPGDEEAVHGGGEDPDRFGGAARGDAHLGALPPRANRTDDVLPLVEGVFGCRQER